MKSSLNRVIGDTETSPAEIMAMRRKAYARRFYTFTEAELARLSDFARLAIQSAAKEIFER